jgi:hypothetical protein
MSYPRWYTTKKEAEKVLRKRTSTVHGWDLFLIFDPATRRYGMDITPLVTEGRELVAKYRDGKRTRGKP